MWIDPRRCGRYRDARSDRERRTSASVRSLALSACARICFLSCCASASASFSCGAKPQGALNPRQIPGLARSQAASGGADVGRSRGHICRGGRALVYGEPERAEAAAASACLVCCRRHASALASTLAACSYLASSRFVLASSSSNYSAAGRGMRHAASSVQHATCARAGWAPQNVGWADCPTGLAALIL